MEVGSGVDQGQRRPRAGHCRRLWERLWERRLELGANTYGVRFLFPPPIGSWESLVDVVAGSSPVGGTRSYCIPNRAGESQFPSVSPPEPTIGLSPRVRGNRSGSAPLSVMTRSIPACAGEPVECIDIVEGFKVYPRVCGGTDAQVKSFEPVSGLSPRVRGNQYGNRPRGPNDRSIPACAGEPASHNLRTTTSRVYPRVCGGTAETLRHVNYMQGLSPRVRGNPTEGYRAGFSLRSIPACAGEPRHHSPRSPLV